MGERTSYDPGTFSYAELATSDAEAAQAFYTAVFGWTYDSIPMGDDMPPYHPIYLDGKQAGALFEAGDQPPHWNSYVTVASVADASAKAAELGATVVMEPFDVMGLGDMAVISDPSGAFLSNGSSQMSTRSCTCGVRWARNAAPAKNRPSPAST